MSVTDISEKGLETLIMLHMTGVDGLVPAAEGVVAEAPAPSGSGWLAGNPKDYDRSHALDLPQLFQFLLATQPEAFRRLGIADYKDAKDINQQKFLARLSNEIGKRGVIDILRKGIEHHPVGHFGFGRAVSASRKDGLAVSDEGSGTPSGCVVCC